MLKISSAVEFFQEFIHSSEREKHVFRPASNFAKIKFEWNSSQKYYQRGVLNEPKNYDT